MGSGFVGVRCPAHEPARALLRAAAVPIGAPSTNRFGHVSPKSADHAMADLGAHQILVLRAYPGEVAGGVGIESAVASSTRPVTWPFSSTAPPRSSRSPSRAVSSRPTAADGPRAAAVLFETLRWAERQADGGARVILLPDLGDDDDEHVPALADRLYRAASGERCRVGADGTLAGDAADAVLARASAD